jgi:serine/threonine protein kinase
MYAQNRTQLGNTYSPRSAKHFNRQIAEWATLANTIVPMHLAAPKLSRKRECSLQGLFSIIRLETFHANGAIIPQYVAISPIKLGSGTSATVKVAYLIHRETDKSAYIDFSTAFALKIIDVFTEELVTVTAFNYMKTNFSNFSFYKPHAQKQYYLMPLYKGINLDSWLKQNIADPNFDAQHFFSDFLVIANNIGQALSELMMTNLSHGDIHCGNVMIKPNLQTQLTDFDSLHPLSTERNPLPARPFVYNKLEVDYTKADYDFLYYLNLLQNMLLRVTTKLADSKFQQLLVTLQELIERYKHEYRQQADLADFLHKLQTTILPYLATQPVHSSVTEESIWPALPMQRVSFKTQSSPCCQKSKLKQHSFCTRCGVKLT